ncbi:serine hydrolase domain-containing protein [Acinetobacter calcoaceticus]|uniref:serine hydrolase domain-containing protein n=1 Tax=Acinetobacter calcoaceticus TaxID=471 RepID=UPI002B290C06|nr:serine hydrolase domain-containing protein [Acinetobacter baumannii]
MSRELKVSEYILVIFLLILVVVFIYFYVNTIERNKLIVKLYPVQAYFEKKAIQCSKNSPAWLKDTILETTMTHQAPNNQIAYLDPNGNLYHCESGYLGWPLFSKKVDENTRFRYASVSKLWVSDAILDLVKENKIHLETPILQLLPAIPKPKDARITKITVQDLLLHRGGFSRTGLIGDEMFQSNKPFCPNHLEKLSQMQLSADPNTVYQYSNLGYCLLGEIIAYQNKTTYQDYIKTHAKIHKEQIQFLENKRFKDEAKYYYNDISLTGYSDIYTAFDYSALASSAGLSGSAVALAHQVQKMIQKSAPNILAMPSRDCDLSKLHDCYSYAMLPYQQNKKSLKVYFRDGVLLGATSLVVVDEYGGIVVLLSGGQAAKGQMEYDRTKMKVYLNLVQTYSSR